MLDLVVGRAELAEGGVSAAWVVEALDEREDRVRENSRVAQVDRSRSSVCRVAKKLSAAELSKQYRALADSVISPPPALQRAASRRPRRPVMHLLADLLVNATAQ